MAVKGFDSVEERAVDRAAPVGSEFKVENRIHGEHEICGGELLAVAPEDPFLQRDFGGPELITADGLFLEIGREIGGD